MEIRDLKEYLHRNNISVRKWYNGDGSFCITLIQRGRSFLFLHQKVTKGTVLFAFVSKRYNGDGPRPA
jgi:hypothetical protein